MKGKRFLIEGWKTFDLKKFLLTLLYLLLWRRKGGNLLIILIIYLIYIVNSNMKYDLYIYFGYNAEEVVVPVKTNKYYLY